MTLKLGDRKGAGGHAEGENSMGRVLGAWQAWRLQGCELRARAAERGCAGLGDTGWILQARNLHVF